MCRGFALEYDFFMGAQAGINHQRKIQRLLRLRLENFNFLLCTFLVKFESFLGKIRRGSLVLINAAYHHVAKTYANLDGAPPCTGRLASGSALRVSRWLRVIRNRSVGRNWR